MQTRLVVVFVSLSLLLQGCMNAAVTGAQTVYNRQSLQKNFKDQYISLQAYQKINNVDNKEFKNANVTVATYNREVLLTGQVPEVWQREKAEALVKKIPDVEKVYNLIKIASPSSTLIRISDAWLTTKVKAKLIASNDVDATQVKVVSENGTVYLMGILPPDQADAAVNIASSTAGVESVVKIFSYITISKRRYII